LAGHFYTGRALDQVDWRVPFFLFTILVAVGEDYNILLITRVLQERKLHGMVEGTRRALAQTGGTITSCGLIMAGTFATLMLGGLGTLIQIGFALASASSSTLSSFAHSWCRLSRCWCGGRRAPRMTLELSQAPKR